METPTQWHFQFHGNKTSIFFLKTLGPCLINSAPQLLRIYLLAVIIQSTSKCLLESSNTQHLPDEHSSVGKMSAEQEIKAIKRVTEANCWQ